MIQKKSPQIPVKWLVLLVFGLVVYGLGQPLVNRKFGWQLPTLASLLGYQQAGGEAKQPTVSRKSSTSVNEDASSGLRGRGGQATMPSSPAVDSVQTANAADPNEIDPQEELGDTVVHDAKGQSTDAAGANPTKPRGIARPQSRDEKHLLYGLLKEIGRDDYISPSGLRFTRGSDEGHRLKHLERHLEDQPDRPGKHGIFYGDMPQVIRWLDEAYDRASSGAKGTTRRDEDGRTVFEVNFSKPIGYIGGREGARQKNPDTKRLRLVVDGNRMITAFPF